MSIGTILTIIIAVAIAPVIISIICVMTFCAGLAVYGAWRFVAECLWEIIHGKNE